VTLLIVTAASIITAGSLLNGQIEALQNKLTTQADRSLRLVAGYAAEDARLKFARRFEQVREMIRDGQLSSQLVEWNQMKRQQRQSVIEGLRTRSERQIHPVLQHLMKTVQTSAHQSRPQSRTNNVSGSDTFSWFVCDAEGYQVARYPPKETIGQQFHYRSYYSGVGRDLPSDVEFSLEIPQWSDPEADQQTTEPRLSASFLTDTKDAWVLAVSAPLWNEAGEFQGVAGIFIQLGDVVRVPEIDEGAERFMAIYDARQNRLSQARPIQHIRYNKDAGKKVNLSVDLQVPASVDLHALLQLEKETGSPIASSTFRDPFLDGAGDGTDPWRLMIESHSPVPDLYVVMQERQSLVHGPGTKLRGNLILMGLSIAAFSAAVLIPVWIMILRRVVRN
jgi:predicted Fe-S protein YdhL (DUF1289 family)